MCSIKCILPSNKTYRSNDKEYIFIPKIYPTAFQTKRIRLKSYGRNIARPESQSTTMHPSLPPQNSPAVPLREDIHPTSQLRCRGCDILPGVRRALEVPIVAPAVDFITLRVPGLAALAASWGCGVPAYFALVPAFGGGLYVGRRC